MFKVIFNVWCGHPPSVCFCQRSGKYMLVLTLFQVLLVELCTLFSPFMELIIYRKKGCDSQINWFFSVLDGQAGVEK